MKNAEDYMCDFCGCREISCRCTPEVPLLYEIKTLLEQILSTLQRDLQ